MFEFAEIGMTIDFRPFITATVWLIILIKIAPKAGKFIKEMIEKHWK